MQDEIQSYHWSKEYCQPHPLIVHFIDGDGNISPNSLMIMTKIQILFMKYKQKRLLLITLKKTFQLWIRCSISMMAKLNNVTAKTLLICIMISKTLVWMLNEYSLLLAMTSHQTLR